MEADKMFELSPGGLGKTFVPSVVGEISGIGFTQNADGSLIVTLVELPSLGTIRTHNYEFTAAEWAQITKKLSQGLNADAKLKVDG